MSNLHKVLVIRFSSIGDIVLTSPVLRCLKTEFPQLELHFLTKEKYKELVAYNPYLNKIHYLKPSIFETINILKKEQFDLVIDLHNNQRTFLIKRLLHTPSKTFKKLNFKKWLLVKFKLNKLPKIHIVERYLNTLRPWNINYDGKGLDYFLNLNDDCVLHDNNQVDIKQYVAIAIGGNHQTKIIPEALIVKIIDAINFPVVLLGGKEDFIRGESIVKQSMKPIINKSGLLSLNQSATIIANSIFVISGDTGLMHIAAAFKKPIISIWGNTVPEFGMYPCLPHANKDFSYIIENNSIKCRPCSKLGYKKCPKKHFNCMNAIDFSMILKAISYLEKDYMNVHGQ